MLLVGFDGIFVIIATSYYRTDALSRLETTSLAVVLPVLSGQSEASLAQDQTISAGLAGKPTIKGGMLFGKDGREVLRFGEVPNVNPALGPTSINAFLAGPHHDVVWSPAQLGSPYQMVARLDSSKIEPAATAFAWRLARTTGAISIVVWAIAMAVTGGTFRRLIDQLKERIELAIKNPAEARAYRFPDSQRDEIGAVFVLLNKLLSVISDNCGTPMETIRKLGTRVSDAILAYDESGDLLYANRSCVRLCGFNTFEEMRRSPPTRFEFEGSAAVSLPESLAIGSYSREALLKRNDGQTIPVMISAARLVTTPEFPVRFYASITDVSLLRSTLDQLEKQNMELGTASRSKSEFIANMNHELRTPLNAIIGFSSVMKEQAFGPIGSPQYLNYLNDIHNSGSHLLGIINDILDL